MLQLLAFSFLLLETKYGSFTQHTFETGWNSVCWLGSGNGVWVRYAKVDQGYITREQANDFGANSGGVCTEQMLPKLIRW